jgi:hypothetical protein
MKGRSSLPRSASDAEGGDPGRCLNATGPSKDVQTTMIDLHVPQRRQEEEICRAFA